MSTWTAPATGVTGAVAVAFWNTEVRDHLLFLKGALDKLTASTTADTGTSMRLNIVRTLSTDNVLEGQVTGDTTNRIVINASGLIQFSHGNDTLRSGMLYHANSYLSVEMPMSQVYPMRLFTKNGIIGDGDIPGYFAGSATGMIGYDTANNRLYVRGGAGWRYVATI